MSTPIPSDDRYCDPQTPETRELRTRYIATRREIILDGVLFYQRQVINQLFVLNTGGAVGILTYLASRTSNGWTNASLVLFAVGILGILGYSARMYFGGKAFGTSFDSDVEEYYENSMGWQKLLKNHSLRGWVEWALPMSVSSAVAFVAGLVCAALGIIGLPK